MDPTLYEEQFLPQEASHDAEVLSIIDEIATSLNYALMGVITLTMYHLKLTLRFLIEYDCDYSQLDSDKMARRLKIKEKCSTIVMCTASALFASLLIVSNAYDLKEDKITTTNSLLQTIFYVLLLITYAWVTFSLKSYVERLQGMEEEKKEIKWQ